MKDKILELRSQGKTYSEIVRIVGCDKSTVSYYCGMGQKEKSLNRQRKRRKDKPLLNKLNAYKNRSLQIKVNDFQRKKSFAGAYTEGRDNNFVYEDLIKKIGDYPICYLTGRPINILFPNTYHLDHIIPVSKGGINTLENLGLACKEANKAKDDLSIEEFINLCKDVLKYNGFIVSQIESKLSRDNTSC